ncbi:MAG: hypothetical protein CDJEALGM_01388 [Ignavibacteria bacterium]|nr:hypothetical protein [Ignavibacteria bacterium]
MKLLLSILFSALFLLSLNVKDSYSQPVTITIGTQVVQSGTTGYGPTNRYYKSYRIQWVITAAEISAAGGGAGNIESMAYDVSQIAGGDLVNYEVRMAHTTATDASSHNTATLTTVVNSHTFTPGSTGWRTLTFDTPFNWNGTDNILVDVCWGVNSAYTSNGQVWLYNNVSNQLRGIRNDVTNQCGTNTNSTRSGKPRVQLTLPPVSNPVLSVTPSSKNFGDVTVNQTSAQVFDITNAGADTLTVNGISVADTTYFKFTDTNSYPVSLVSGQHIYVTVTFTPTDTGSQSTDMTVNSDIDTSTVALSGKGIKYCIPQANCASEYISNVTFSDLNLTSGSSCTNGYMDSSATHFANIIRGNTYTLSFTVVEAGTEYVRAWFDWNGDYILDTTEQYSYPTGITVSGTYTMDITVPGSAILDTTRMRVYMKWNSYPTPCVTGGYGEAEDYSVVITQPTEPVLSVSPGSKDFGTLLTGDTASQVFDISNSGIGTLNISSIVISDTTYFRLIDTNTYPAAIDTAAHIYVTVKFIVPADDTASTNMVITDDLLDATTNIPLDGIGVQASYGSNGQTGDNLYYFANSLATGAPSHPPYEWTSPSGDSVTLIANQTNCVALGAGNVDDGRFDITGQLPPGNSIKFFGNDYTNFYIGTNGIIGFTQFTPGSPNYNPPTNGLPSATNVDTALFPLWLDISFSNLSAPTSGRLWYEIKNDYLVISYDSAYVLGGTSDNYVSFQIVIQHSNTPTMNSWVIFRYSDDYSGPDFKSQYNANTLRQHLIGLEGTGLDASQMLQYRFRNSSGEIINHGPIFGSNLALAFGPNEQMLPVDLLAFDASVYKNDVTLTWTTGWEENNERFDIQRRVNNPEAQWKTVGSVKGSGTVHEERTYTFTDKKLVTGKYEYRLVQVDFDGNVTADHNLKNVVEIGIPTVFDLSQNYPNPFNPTTKIDFQIPVEGLVKLNIIDMAGREVATLVNETLVPGYYTYDFNASKLASGIYFYRLITKNNVITKKMALIK